MKRLWPDNTRMFKPVWRFRNLINPNQDDADIRTQQLTAWRILASMGEAESRVFTREDEPDRRWDQ